MIESVAFLIAVLAIVGVVYHVAYQEHQQRQEVKKRKMAESGARRRDQSVSPGNDATGT